MRIIAVLYLNNYGFKESIFTQLLTFGVEFICFYCEDPFSIVFNVLAYGFCCFWLDIAYKRDPSMYQNLLIVFSIVGLFTAECAAGIVGIKIANLY